MIGLDFTAHDLRSALANWPDSSQYLEGKSTEDGLLSRLQQCLHGLINQVGNATQLDLIALLRHWLLSQASEGTPPWLQVPLCSSWPSSQLWSDHGFEVADLGTCAQIRPYYPKLSWLGEQQDLFDDAFNGVIARLPTRIPSDPLMRSLLGLPYYSGPGQREAIRALMHLPADTTLIANLPTGSGKSLLAQLPPLAAKQGTLTLVIVPTVALAIDQGERMAEFFARRESQWTNRPLSYHSGLSSEERSTVYQALRRGDQRVLFTSPEAATGSLRRLLIDCASEGRISHVVIDEAHLVVTWGSGFRPAFQLLPALIASLREARKPETPQQIRVVLASATLTPHTVITLQKQFAGSMGHCVVSGIFLRPEPRYAMKFFDTNSERKKKVLEAVFKAPRPFILYVTRPEEADDWTRFLKVSGLGRIAAFTGETPTNQRRLLMAAWGKNNLDGMVATSAFGLGVDKNDVRCVIHATLPESLDRYYQEIGRSGRDGLASASLLLFTSEDVNQASDMASPKFIGNDLGYERWLAMLDDPARPVTSDGEIWVDLNRLRSELTLHGRSNRLWNLRTLNLMAEAGLIEIVGLSDSTPGVGTSDQDTEYSDGQVSYAAVRIRNPSHRDLYVYEKSMNAARLSMNGAADLGFRLIYRVAQSQVEISQALIQLYGLDLPNHWGPVSAYCGGCIQHWGENRMPIRKLRPFVARIDHFAPRLDHAPELQSLPREQENLAFIVTDDLAGTCSDRRSILMLLLQKVRPHTLWVPLSASDSLVESLISQMTTFRSDTFVDRFDPRDPTTLLGSNGELRFILWLDSLIAPEAGAALQTSPCSMTIVFINRQLPDPSRPDRPWSSIVAHAEEETILRKLIG